MFKWAAFWTTFGTLFLAEMGDKTQIAAITLAAQTRSPVSVFGITEDSDAVAVVVSEETGLISFVEGGQIRRGLDATKLRAAIFHALEAPAAKAAREKESEATAKKEAETEVIST